MKKNIAIKALFCFLALTVASSPAVAHGASQELAVMMIVTIKRACDLRVPGYSAATDNAFNKWKKENAALIEQTKKVGNGAEGFDEFVKKGVDQMLGKPKVELQQACSDFQKSLNADAQ